MSGRPEKPLEERKTQKVSFYLTKDQEARIKQAAGICRTTVGDWARKTVLEIADCVIEDPDTFDPFAKKESQ